MSVLATAPPLPEELPAVYRPRNPRVTPLYQLLDTHYDAVKGMWEERFERRYGFWRGFYESAVHKYFDCGLLESGFARVVCPRCHLEFLVAFSCKARGLCPSCTAKRAAIFSELLQHKILADVPHAQWVFSIPKMLRPYFLHHRELLGDLARLAYETAREMMVAVSDEPATRPGMVAVIQTFGSSLKWNPHIHAIASRGAWTPDGTWHPIPYVDAHKAELLFRHKVLAILRERELISQERIDLLLSWKNSGFSVHNRTTVYPSDTEGLHKLACYLMRAPVNLSRLRFDSASRMLIYEPKAGHDVDDDALIDPLEFLARALIHVPQPNKHLVHFYGVYANRVRVSCREARSHTSSGGSRGAPTSRYCLPNFSVALAKLVGALPAMNSSREDLHRASGALAEAVGEVEANRESNEPGADHDAVRDIERVMGSRHGLLVDPQDTGPTPAISSWPPRPTPYTACTEEHRHATPQPGKFMRRRRSSYRGSPRSSSSSGIMVR